jgi:hypothetical protein
MTYEPTAAHLAVELTRLHVGSARPDAPVVGDQQTGRARLATTRELMASSLRSVARWVEPSRRPANVAS